MDDSDPSRDRGCITLTADERDALRREIVMSISCDAIGDHIDKPDHVEWALEMRAASELAFKVLDDLGWAPDGPLASYTLRAHDGLVDFLERERADARVEVESQARDLKLAVAGDRGQWYGDDLDSTVQMYQRELDSLLDLEKLCDNLLDRLRAASGRPEEVI